MAQVVLDTGTQLRWLLRCGQSGLCVVSGADLADEDEVVRVGRERFPRRLVARTRNATGSVCSTPRNGADGCVSLGAVAREAGVGIGTLYRHFPTREALIEAVYRSELAKVCERATTSVGRHPGDVGLRRWMDRYAAFVRTKSGMAEALHGLMSSGAIAASDTRDRIRAAVDTFLHAGADDGTLRADVDAEDVTAAMVGALLAAHDKAQTARLLGLLVDGLRPRQPGHVER